MDGGWGWVVLFGAFISYFIADGWSYSFGILFPEMVSYFGESKGTTALVPTLLYGIPMILSPVVCAFVLTFGYQRVTIIGGVITCLSFVFASFASSVSLLCIAIGILTSIGLAMTYVPSFIAVTYYFDKKRGLATGLAVTGSGLGAFAFPPLIEYLLQEYHWRGALLIVGGISLNISFAGCLYRPLPDEEMLSKSIEPSEIEMISEKSSQHKSNSITKNFPAKSTFYQELRMLIRSMLDKSLLHEKTFLWFCAANFILYLWISIPYVYLYDKALELDSGDKQSAGRAAFLLSIIGIARTVGQIVIGLISDLKFVSANLLFGGSVAILGIATLLVPLCISYTALCVYCVFFGFFISATYVLPMMCLVEIITLQRATNAFGLLQLVQGIGTLFGTPIGGWLFDRLGHYDTSFIISGALMLFSGLLVVPVPLFMRKSKKKKVPTATLR